MTDSHCRPFNAQREIAELAARLATAELRIAVLEQQNRYIGPPYWPGWPSYPWPWPSWGGGSTGDPNAYKGGQT